MYAVQESYTFEWVTTSTHDTFEDAVDAVQEALDEGAAEDRVRMIEV